MTVMFSAREILEAAVEKEKKRGEFYAKVSALSSNPDMKKVFQWLTEEEARHVAAFSQMRDSLPELKRDDEYSMDMDAYMDSVIDDRLYSQIDSQEFVQRAVDNYEAFRMAIGFEKDAILYFREFLPHLTESDAKIVMDLIEQEKGHIRRLVEVRRQMGI